MEVWKFIHEKLTTSVEVFLLWVLESEGSSPGRQGFKMAVAEDGEFYGTIGGGMMEHKLVEKAKSLLAEKITSISLQRQYHDKQHNKDQSGMICSGSQLIAFVPLLINDAPVVEQIIKSIEINKKNAIHLNLNGLSISQNTSEENLVLKYKSNEEWQYAEAVDQRPVIHIIGGGHVGLALSELMNYLNFYVKLYDNRPQLNTFLQNKFAHEKHIVNYEQIGKTILENKDEYLVIMTFGYRDDKIVFKQLLEKEFFYAGMMGSESKIKTLFEELENEGINSAKWKNWFIPIGINIYSKTTKEIAVSIASEIIREKNKLFPTGRTEKSFSA